MDSSTNILDTLIKSGSWETLFSHEKPSELWLLDATTQPGGTAKWPALQSDFGHVLGGSARRRVGWGVFWGWTGIGEWPPWHAIAMYCTPLWPEKGRGDARREVGHQMIRAGSKSWRDVQYSTQRSVPRVDRCQVAYIPALLTLPP